MRHLTLTTALMLSTTATTALADLAVRFVEGAPTDRFEFENNATCPIMDATLTVDLAGSVAGLIFDVTGAGAGVQVYQPFEIVAGAQSLSAVPTVKDGDTGLAMQVTRLAPGDRIVFTIDVDDTIDQRESIVSNAEIEGATVRLLFGGTSYSATFTGQADARITLPPCPTT